ncbi:cysteine desulfurase [Pandoraea captiosa]|uniref:Cysteine desulfurase n=1 Tax=Pandoraea captiosa TaxID=2508302 RepID=A0A5E4ZJX8_9BURK|nr:aminotransferase class V-fold PLP-dependent enzyme [Pandoraea captiosa]VVE60533.1 cysteine desulfurase [Pandoraea captiosa]
MADTYRRHAHAMDAEEVLRLRRTTPAAEAAVHLNHASASLADQSVFDAQQRYLALEASVGPHRAYERVAEALEALPEALGALVGVHAGQVALTESASRGWALALGAVSRERPLQVFVGPQEWGGNVMNVIAHPRASLRRVDGRPGACWKTLIDEALTRRDPRAIPVVSLPLIGAASGEIHALAGVASVVHEAGGWLFVDASQAVGQMPVDATALGADVLVFPSRKWLRGPRGIGVLCLSPRALTQFETPALVDVFGAGLRCDVHATPTLAVDDTARRFQIYEHNPGLRLGLLAAIGIVEAIGVERIHARSASLIGRLHGHLRESASVVWSDAPQSGMLCAVFRDATARYLADGLRDVGVNVACVARRYAPLSDQGDADGNVLRISAHALTREGEIDEVADRLHRILTRREGARAGAR